MCTITTKPPSGATFPRSSSRSTVVNPCCNIFLVLSFSPFFLLPIRQISPPATAASLADGANAARRDIAGSDGLDSRGRGGGNTLGSNKSSASNASITRSDDCRGGSVASSAPRVDDADAAASVPTATAGSTGLGSDRIDGEGECGVGVDDPGTRPREGAGEGEESEAPGTWWGVSGWFSRRSSTSPPPPVDGAVGVGGAGSLPIEGAGELGQAREAHGRALEYQPDGAKAGDAADKKSVLAPPSLSMELVGKAAVSNDRSNEGGAVGAEGGLGNGEHGHDDDDEDEDIYGKTLRPTSEQLVRI